MHEPLSDHAARAKKNGSFFAGLGPLATRRHSRAVPPPHGKRRESRCASEWATSAGCGGRLVHAV
jgi:hypothetical protein